MTSLSTEQMAQKLRRSTIPSIDLSVDEELVLGVNPPNDKCAAAQELWLLETALQMRRDLRVRDRWWRRKSHRATFVGSEAVHWIIDRQKAANLRDAVLLGQRMMDRKVFGSVVGGGEMENSTTLFRFVGTEQDLVRRWNDAKIRALSSGDTECSAEFTATSKKSSLTQSTPSKRSSEAAGNPGIECKSSSEWEEGFYHSIESSADFEDTPRSTRNSRFRARTHRSPLRQPKSPHSPRNERKGEGGLMW